MMKASNGGGEIMRGLKEVLADQALMDQIEEAVRKAGWQMTRSHVEENEIEKKEGRSNFVTRYDRMNQEYLRDRFRELLPEAAFVGEEDQEHKDRLPDGFVWIVDPIDGTTNFLFDLHLSCVSAGLLYDGVPVAGFVYNPYTDEMFRAIQGQGAFRNGRRIRTEDLPLEEGIAFYGCAAYNDEHIRALMDYVSNLFQRALGIRTLGTGAWALCMVAGGGGVIYTEFALKPWDYAASVIILQEAGCLITQMDGSPVSFVQPSDIMAGTPRAHRQCVEMMKRCLEEEKR